MSIFHQFLGLFSLVFNILEVLFLSGYGSAFIISIASSFFHDDSRKEILKFYFRFNNSYFSSFILFSIKVFSYILLTPEQPSEFSGAVWILLHACFLCIEIRGLKSLLCSLQDWCKENFVNSKNMLLVAEVRAQLREICLKVVPPFQ